MKIITLNLFFYTSVLTIIGCNINTSSNEQIKKKSDLLFDKIAKGNANQEFSEKHFPRDQTERIMSDLKNNCDFQNRKGHFLNDYYSDDKSKLSLIYEFYLKCDSIRFILTYDLRQEELYEFKMESIEKDNPQITDQTKRLKY